MIYKRPDKTFDATSCGPNCARMLLEIGKRENITVGLRYLLPLDGLEPFEVEIANTGHIVRNTREYSLEALDCLDEAES